MSNKNIIITVSIALVGVALIGGLWAYNFVLGEAEAPSSPITAIPIVVNTAQPEADAAVLASEGSTSAEPTAAEGAAQGGLTIFQISSDQSEVRFSIYEELAGQPKTVVGVSDQVAGELALDLSDLSKTQVGVIQINARTFVTDSDNRNRAIRNFILGADEYEFITFTPTAITGLSGAAQPGQAFTFQIAGNLTIRDVTQPVMFEVTAQGDSLTRLTGTATAVVKRSDYNLTIPSVPNVANVGEEVTLELEFVAEAA
jgi:polyisoprenoid-binding protein YceI